MTKDAKAQKGKRDRARVTSAGKRMVSFHLNSNQGPKRPKMTDAREKLNQKKLSKGVKKTVEKVGVGEMVSKGETSGQGEGGQGAGGKIYHFYNCNNITFN